VNGAPQRGDKVWFVRSSLVAYVHDSALRVD
jgi:hypothetical protein